MACPLLLDDRKLSVDLNIQGVVLTSVKRCILKGTVDPQYITEIMILPGLHPEAHPDLFFLGAFGPELIILFIFPTVGSAVDKIVLFE